MQWTVLQISSNMLIDNNIIFSSLPAVCLSVKSDCTSTSSISVCQSIQPVLLSLPGSSDSSINPFFLSVCLSCLGCVDSSSVSCRRSVLLRHGQWSDACTLSADGQVTILSHTFFPQKFILPISPLASSLSLSFSVICLHLHLPP